MSSVVNVPGGNADDGGRVNVGASTSNSSQSLPVLAPNAAKRRKRASKDDNSDDDDAESVVEVENDDEEEDDSDRRADNFSEVHVETFRAHYDIKIRNFCQAINEKVNCLCNYPLQQSSFSFHFIIFL